MRFDFVDLVDQLQRLKDHNVRVLYLGVVADGRVPLPAEANASGLKIRWSGRLIRVRCIPDVLECTRFKLRPQRLILMFDRGVRMVVEVQQLVAYRPKQDGLHLLLRQGRAIYILTRSEWRG